MPMARKRQAAAGSSEVLKSKKKKSRKKKRSKPKRVDASKDQEEKDLETFVFGQELDSAPLPFGKELSQLQMEQVLGGGNKEQPLFHEDRKGDLHAGDDDEQEQAEAEARASAFLRGEAGGVGGKVRRAAWEDEDDEDVKVNLATNHRMRKLRRDDDEQIISGKEYTKRLRERFNAVNHAADWAQLPGEGEGEGEDDSARLMASSASLQAGMSRDGNMLQGTLDVARVKDANAAQYSGCVIQSTRFHPNGQLLLTAGLDKTLRFFQVDGVRNSKVQTVRFNGLPIHSAEFTPDGEEVILTGRRKHFYTYNVVAGKISKIPFIKGRKEKSLETFTVSPDNKLIAFLGKDGYIVLVSNKTKQWVANLKMNGSVRAVSFGPDGKLYSLGSDGEMYVWDVGTRRCVYRHKDLGNNSGTALGLSGCGRYYATGSTSGVVNVYNTSRLDGSPENVKPMKELMNLVTPIDDVRFNHDGQLLAMASRRKKDQMRMIHLPSMTAFSNWPTAQTPLGYVNSVDFSPHSGYFAVGNDKGKVLLYRLHHYHTS